MAGNVEPEPISEPPQELFDYGHARRVAAAEFWKHRNPGWRLSTGECSTGVTTSGSPRLRRSTAVVRGAGPVASSR
ncbi:hypothetical protein GS580_27645 [Rhodococcus hoagii]|nr:hypothetical protein [Prescottella equi]